VAALGLQEAARDDAAREIAAAHYDGTTSDRT
jgi:hypothetical protein